MALEEKILGTKGKERLDFDLEKYFGVEGSLDREELRIMAKAPKWDGSPYKMKDLFPDTYRTMTTVPTDIDFSTLECVDGMFEDCEALVSADGLDISGALSADGLFRNCTSLLSANDILWRKGISRRECFMGCTSLTTPPVIDFSYAPNVRSIFEGCSSLPAIFPYTVDLSQYSDHQAYRAMLASSSVTEISLTPRPVNIPFDAMFAKGTMVQTTGTTETTKGYLREAFIHYLNGGTFPGEYNIDFTYETLDENNAHSGYQTISVSAKDAFDAFIVVMEGRYEYFLKTWLWRIVTPETAAKTLNFVFNVGQEEPQNE